jgi:8-oxo-dGTP pyrophosphatase MutT (NUDIX family)
MHRQKLIQALQSYVPSFEERETSHKIINFVQENCDCFERTLAPGHITASAWLLNKAGTHALLMHHAKLGIWVQLGGHCDGDADTLRVAIKEAQEESGISAIEPVSPAIFDLDIHFIPASKKEPAHYHYDIRYLLRVASDESFAQNSESLQLRWFEKNEELPTESRAVTRIAEKWRALKL